MITKKFSNGILFCTKTEVNLKIEIVFVYMWLPLLPIFQNLETGCAL